MANRDLSQSDRAFLSLVSQLAFSNPFSEKRIELNKKISGLNTYSSNEDVFQKAILEVNRRISELDKNGYVKVGDFNKADRELLSHCFLFSLFHQFKTHFDTLIIDQISIGKDSIKVDFANDLLFLLQKRGFDRNTAKRFFALLFQIRRAFYFIDRRLIGKSYSMQLFRMNLWNNIFTYDLDQYESYLWDKMEDFSTLLLGPTGSGKGAAASAIGQSGFIPFDDKNKQFTRSFTNSFIDINLSQYPETLLESELFGHTKGAFTGASTSHDGLFAMCGKHGSVFLDEIGDVSIQVQIKLLKILQDRIFTPVGSHKKLRFGGRVVAATNKSIDKLRANGKFRDDFYYRLCSDCITVPSLYERIQENPNELTELIIFKVKQICGKENGQLINNILDVIDNRLGKNYHWPGNVRELEQCIRRIIIKRDYKGDTAVVSEDLQTQFFQNIKSNNLDAQSLMAAYCMLLYKKHKTYENVAQITNLDRRTVKKYIQSYSQNAISE